MLPPRQPLLAMGPSSESVRNDEMTALAARHVRMIHVSEACGNMLCLTTYRPRTFALSQSFGGRELDKHIKYM